MKNKVFTNKIIEIGGYSLPADFKYFDKTFLKSLLELDFCEVVSRVYTTLTNRKLDKNHLFDELEVCLFDESISAIDFSCGNTVNYNDFIFDSSDLLGSVSSIISIVVASYLDLINSNIINEFEEVNFAVPANDGIFVLSLYIVKKIGLPINTIIVGSEKNTDLIVKGVYLSKCNEEDVEDIVGVFFDEYDMGLDLISATGVLALDDYYSNYDDENLTILFLISSPYLFARKVLKCITGEIELSVDKAIDKLKIETSQEIPRSIQNKEIPLYYVDNIKIPFDTAMLFVKELSKD